MPRRRKTEAQRRAEKIGELYRIGKSRIGATDAEIGGILGIDRSTLRRKRNTPEKMSLGEFVNLGKALGWTEQEFLSVLLPQK